MEWTEIIKKYLPGIIEFVCVIIEKLNGGSGDDKVKNLADVAITGQISRSENEGSE